MYPGNNLEQKHGQLLSVSPDEDAIDTASSPDRGDGIKLLRSAIVPCDKEAGFLFPEFLESAPESNMPLPDPGVHVHEHSTSSKLFASCPTMVPTPVSYLVDFIAILWTKIFLHIVFLFYFICLNRNMLMGVSNYL